MSTFSENGAASRAWRVTLVASVALHLLALQLVGPYLDRPVEPMEEAPPLEVQNVSASAVPWMSEPAAIPQPVPADPPPELTPPEDAPEPEPIAEEAPEAREEPEPESEPQPPQQQEDLHSVVQPQSNDEAPDESDLVAARDNTVDEQTVAPAEEQEPALSSPPPGTAPDDTARDQSASEMEPSSDDEVVPAEPPASPTSDDEQATEVARALPAIDRAPDATPRLDETPREPDALEETEQAPGESADPAVREGPGEATPSEGSPLPTLRERMLQAAETREQRSDRGGSVAERAASVDGATYRSLFADRDAADRERLAQEARESSFLGDHEGDWERTRAALMNHDVAIRTGTETHLNTRANAFAGYINYLHAKIHPIWAGQYIPLLRVTYGADHPLSDRSTVAVLEYVIDDGGEVENVAVVRSSGVTSYDAEAIRMLYDIGPHSPPPRGMRSFDGNTYIHWAFHRNRRQCGTFNASVRFLSPSETDGEQGSRSPRAPEDRALAQRRHGHAH